METSNQNPMKEKEVLEKIQAIALGLLGFNKGTKQFDWGQSLYNIHRYLEDRLKTENVERGNEGGKENRKAVLDLINQGMNQKAISETLGLSKGYVSKIRKRAIEEGYLNPDGSLTGEGLNLIQPD